MRVKRSRSERLPADTGRRLQPRRDPAPPDGSRQKVGLGCTTFSPLTLTNGSRDHRSVMTTEPATTYTRSAFASVVGVSPQTVDTWRKRRILTPNRDASGCYVFTQADVERVRPRVELLAQRPHSGLTVRAVLDVLPADERDLVEADLNSYAPALTTAIREALS